MDQRTNMLRSAGTIGGLTTVSRILGYLRDAALAMVLGAGFGMDAFTIGYRVANLFRRFLAEGAMTTAFVPVFSEFREKHSEKELWNFARTFFYTLGLWLTVIVALEIIFAPFITNLLAPGFREVAGKWELTIYLSRIMAPYLLFVGLASVLMAVLNSLKSYAVSAANPIFFNLAIIFAAFVLTHFFEEPTVAIAIGILIGGFFQMAVQIPSVIGKGMPFVPRVSLHHPAIRKIMKLMAPGVFGVGIYQINLVVDSVIGSFLPQGSVSFLYYANRVVELVQGIFIISFATVILTEMSAHAAARRHAEMRETLLFSLKMVSFVTVPASAALMVLARPITQVLFEHGEFSGWDTTQTAYALVFYAVGIFFVAGARIVVQAFYAVQDSKTPVIAAVVSLAVNIVCSIALVFPFKQGGIALATSIAAGVNFFQLLAAYRKRFGPLGLKQNLPSFGRVLLQTGVMIAACLIVLYAARYGQQTSLLGRAVVLFSSISVGLAVYGGSAAYFKSEELSYFFQSLTRRRKVSEASLD